MADAGLVEPDKLRLTIEARREKVNELVGAGMSQRKGGSARNSAQRIAERSGRSRPPQTAKSGVRRRLSAIRPWLRRSATKFTHSRSRLSLGFTSRALVAILIASGHAAGTPIELHLLTLLHVLLRLLLLQQHLIVELLLRQELLLFGPIHLRARR